MIIGKGDYKALGDNCALLFSLSIYMSIYDATF